MRVSDRNTRKNIGVMGGMFDPVHQGHLVTALQAKSEFALDTLHLVPCGSPVHREPALASDHDRIAMLKLATQTEPGLLVDERECISNVPSYMFNTLCAIKQENLGSRIFFILGVDAFNAFSSWYKWQDLLDLVHLLVISRPGWELDVSTELLAQLNQREVASYAEMVPHEAGKILLCTLKKIAISSSEIRKLIEMQQPLQEFLSEPVLSYINAHQLYGVTGV